MSRWPPTHLSTAVKKPPKFIKKVHQKVPRFRRHVVFPGSTRARHTCQESVRSVSMVEPNCHGLAPPTNPFVKLQNSGGGSKSPIPTTAPAATGGGSRRLHPSEVTFRSPLPVPTCGDDRRTRQVQNQSSARSWSRTTPKVAPTAAQSGRPGPARGSAHLPGTPQG